jgi:hypothetical protein
MRKIKNNKQELLISFFKLVKEYFYDILEEWEFANSNSKYPFPSIAKMFFTITNCYSDKNQPDLHRENQIFEKFKNVIFYLKELGRITLDEDKETGVVRIVECNKNFKR